MARASLQKDLFTFLVKTQGCVDPRRARLDSTPGLGQEGRPSRAPGKRRRTSSSEPTNTTKAKTTKKKDDRKEDRPKRRLSLSHQREDDPAQQKTVPFFGDPSSRPPRRSLSPSQSEGTVLAGAIGRNHEANSSGRWFELRGLPRALKGRPVPMKPMGAGVERKRDGKPWVWFQGNLRVLKGRFSGGGAKGGNTNPASRRSHWIRTDDPARSFGSEN